VRERLVRLAAPAVIVVLEVEGPTRIVAAADGEPERRALLRWVESSPARGQVLAAALLDGALEDERRDAWTRALAHESGGVAALVVDLLCGDGSAADEAEAPTTPLPD
jgi:hypothetical protein